MMGPFVRRPHVLRRNASQPDAAHLQHRDSARCVYTFWMDDRPVVWDIANRKHIGADHPERAISAREVEEVLTDPNRAEVYLSHRQAYQVVGPTAA